MVRRMSQSLFRLVERQESVTMAHKPTSPDKPVRERRIPVIRAKTQFTDWCDYTPRMLERYLLQNYPNPLRVPQHH